MLAGGRCQMERATSGVSIRFWTWSVGLLVLVFFLALFAAYEWLTWSPTLFLMMIAPAPVVVGFLSRSWLAILAPLLAWALFSLAWAILVVNVSHDPNVMEVLSWLHEDLWPAWPLLTFGFTLGRLTRTAVQSFRRHNPTRGS
jgi:hypothetical protein